MFLFFIYFALVVLIEHMANRCVLSRDGCVFSLQLGNDFLFRGVAS